MKIGIVVADYDEYAPFLEEIKQYSPQEYKYFNRLAVGFNCGGVDVICINCGIGKVNAATAATHLADIGCTYILNYGLSGGISRVHRGEVVLPDKFLEHDFDLTGIGYKPYEKPGQEYVYKADEKLMSLMMGQIPNIKTGTAVSGDCFICDEQVRNTLKNDFDAMSCDMETAAIAYVCNFGNIPFLALRRISDDAGDNAIESYREMNEKAEALLSDIIIDFIPVIVNSYEA